MTPTRLAAVLCAAGLLVVGCGNKDKAAAPSPNENPPITVPLEPAKELTTKDLKVGTGDEITDETVKNLDKVEVNYVGMGQQSKRIFDSSFVKGQTATFALNEVIPAWTQGLKGMKVGGRRQIVTPGSLAYGPGGSPQAQIGPDETLVFVIDLISIKKTVPLKPRDATEPNVTVPTAKANELVKTDLKEGDGEEITQADADKGATITVDYVGFAQSTGKKFDGSFGTGKPATLQLNGVIKGWTNGLVGMKVGGRRQLVIPGSLAYGPDGRPPSIGPDETLVFVIDLLGKG
jgi:FKBP-type peptidyl-prolyl cis-trans isomerase